jgi:hypothetical protein
MVRYSRTMNRTVPCVTMDEEQYAERMTDAVTRHVTGFFAGRLEQRFERSEIEYLNPLRPSAV